AMFSRMAQRSRRGDIGRRAMTPEACADRRLGGLVRPARPSLDRLPTTTRGALRAHPQTRQCDARRGAGCCGGRMCPGPARAKGQGGSIMLRIGGTASPGHITVFRGLKTHFQQQGIALDWVLYSDYDALVEAFATREIDLAWNGPVSY